MRGRARVVLLLALAAPPTAGEEPLPQRVRKIVLHVLGGPMYDRPQLRFAFLTPQETHALWKRQFGAHWIVWTDGTLWPRQPARGEARSRRRPPEDAAGERARLAREAAPVYSHVYGHNSSTLGIELSHSGRSAEVFPDAQVRSLASLLRTLLEMSGGRLTAADVVGHKDLDRRSAYVKASCESAGCPVFVDGAGVPFKRRVDPPESLFAALRPEGIEIPRPPHADAELRRAEALAPGERPAIRDR